MSDTANRKSRTDSSDSPGNAEKKELDKQLGEALEHTFPASDPVSVGQETVEPEGRESRQAAPVNVDLAKKLAKKLEKERARG